MTINEKIKLIRTTKGITQAKFAKLIGINHDSRVREIESGKYKEVGSAKLEKICNLFPEYALWLMTNKIDLKKIKNQQPKRQPKKSTNSALLLQDAHNLSHIAHYNKLTARLISSILGCT